jgi:hypothetical protein
MLGFDGSFQKYIPALRLLPLLLPLTTCFGQYAGSETCRPCHASEYRSQGVTGHARALARSSAGQPGEWAFGAGTQAITFVSRLDAEHYVELGESWYRATHAFALTPGHDQNAGVTFRTFDPSAGIVRCFACHSTGYLQLAEDQSIVPSELGIHCEVCHGPSAAHVANPPAVHPRNPGRMNGVELNALCGSCHRAQSSAEETTDLRDPWNSRHQPLLLAASACFQKSSGRLTCLTCHSPHQALETNALSYNAACQKCHAGVRHVQSVADRACVDCHMPAVRATPNLTFANHRIAVYSPNDALSPVAISKKLSPVAISKKLDTRGQVAAPPASVHSPVIKK